MESDQMVEHPRTYTRHIVDEEGTQEQTGTATLCGLVLPTAPNAFWRDGDECGNCKRLEGC